MAHLCGGRDARAWEAGGSCRRKALSRKVGVGPETEGRFV